MFKLNNLSSLQLFQLTRYTATILIGVGFAQLHLSQSVIGQFETFLLISNMVSFFWVSGIINSLLSIYPTKTDAEKKSLLFTTGVIIVGLSTIVGSQLFLFSDNVLSFLDKDGNGELLPLAVFYLLFNNPSYLTEYILFLNDRKKAIVTYGYISALVSIAAALIPLALGYPLLYSMYGLIAVAILRLVVTVSLLAKYASFHFSFSLMRQHLWISLPVILSIFVSGSAEYIDAVIVKAKFDDVFFAVYRYGAKELPILLIIANTFSTAMIPVIAANLNEGLAEIKEKSAKMMHLLFPLTMVLMLVSPFVYPLVFNASFTYSAYIFNIYLLLIIPRLLFPQTILTGMQHTRYLLLSSVIEIIVNFSLSFYLAGLIGLPGVAIGTFVAYTVDKLFLMGVAHFVYKIPPTRYIKLIPYLVYVTLTIVSFGLGYVILTIG